MRKLLPRYSTDKIDSRLKLNDSVIKVEIKNIDRRIMAHMLLSGDDFLFRWGR